MPLGPGDWLEGRLRAYASRIKVRTCFGVSGKGALASDPDRPVRFEIELWFYASADARGRAYQRLQNEIRQLDGDVVHHVVIPEIRYDAALVDIPPDQVQALIDHPDVTLARVDEIMFLRPQSLAHPPARDELEGEDGEEVPTEPDLPSREPVAALLDGLPIQNHAKLAGRLIIDDPDDLEPAGSPIFLIERTSYTIANRPVDYERLHYRGDLIRFVMRLARRPRAPRQTRGA
jgi:hypothetical protein